MEKTKSMTEIYLDLIDNITHLAECQVVNNHITSNHPFPIILSDFFLPLLAGFYHLLKDKKSSHNSMLYQFYRTIAVNLKSAIDNQALRETRKERIEVRPSEHILQMRSVEGKVEMTIFLLNELINDSNETPSQS